MSLPLPAELPNRPIRGPVSPALMGLLLLLVVTLIWGSTFPLVKRLTGLLDADSLLFLRFSLGALVALPIALRWLGRGIWWRAALEFGLLGWLGYAAQTAGLVHTSAGRSAFITSLSVILVPLLVAWAGHMVPPRIWLAALLAVMGAAMLSNDGSPPNRGDLLTLGTAASYAVYILRLERYAARMPSPALMAAQVLGVLPVAFAALCLQAVSSGARLVPGLRLLAEGWASLPATAWLDLAYLGTVGLGLTAALQAMGQARVPATQAALIFTTEPVWAALFAGVLLGERMGALGLMGGGLILLAAWLGQGLRLKPSRGIRRAKGTAV